MVMVMVMFMMVVMVMIMFMMVVMFMIMFLYNLKEPQTLPYLHPNPLLPHGHGRGHGHGHEREHVLPP